MKTIGLRAWPLRALALALAVARTGSAGETIEFNRDIRPILSENCSACHGPDARHREAGLRLDREEEFNGADLSLHRISSTPERETVA